MPSGIEIVFGQNYNILRIPVISILSLDISADIKCKRHPI
jgi:hypothetical protein